MDNQGQTEERRARKLMYLREYRVTHKDEIASNRNGKIICTCGLEVSKRHNHEHLNSRVHRNALSKRSQELTDILVEKTSADIAQHIMSFI